MSASSIRGDNQATQWIAHGDDGRPQLVKPLHDICGLRPGHDARLVSVIGVARSGKSTLLNIWGNKLNGRGGIGRQGEKRWFGTSDHVDSCTRGAHVAPWCFSGDGPYTGAVAFADCEGQGHEGEEVDAGFFLPLYLMSRVVVWNISSLAKDTVLKTLDNIIAMAEQMDVGVDPDEEDEARYEAARARSRGIFGHLIILVRNCELDGDAEAELLEDEEVKMRGAKVIDNPANKAREQRNEQRARIRHLFESVSVTRLPAPRNAQRPTRDPKFVDAANAVLADVLGKVVLNFHLCDHSLQRPLATLARSAGVSAAHGRRSRRRPAAAASGGGARNGATADPASHRFTFADLHQTVSLVIQQIRERGVVVPAGIREAVERERQAKLALEAEHQRAEVAEKHRLEAQVAEAAAVEAAAKAGRERDEARREREAKEKQLADLAGRMEARDKSHAEEVKKMRKEMEEMQKKSKEVGSEVKDLIRALSQMQMGGGGGGMGGPMGMPPMPSPMGMEQQLGMPSHGAPMRHMPQGNFRAIGMHQMARGGMRQLFQGPRGGQFYFSPGGNRQYIRR